MHGNSQIACDGIFMSHGYYDLHIATSHLVLITTYCEHSDTSVDSFLIVWIPEVAVTETACKELVILSGHIFCDAQSCLVDRLQFIFPPDVLHLLTMGIILQQKQDVNR